MSIPSKSDKLYSGILLSLFLCFSIASHGQLVVDTTLTPEQLVSQVLIGSGVTSSNVTFQGNVVQRGDFFDGETTNLGLEDGVILTSGNIFDIPDECGGNVSSSQNGNLSDPDLNVLCGNNTRDCSILEFDFIPQSDTLTFRYVFGSEEYNEYVCSGFNDVFGFFISGPGINGPYTNNAENIAIVPGSAPPLPVAINSINNGTVGSAGSPANCVSLEYSYLFVDNCEAGGANTTIEYDGFTVVLTAEVVLQACQQYHIKLAVADAGDQAYDSGVFLEANSFSAEGLDISTSFTASSSDFGAVIEGCNDVTIVFELLDVQTTNYPIYISTTGTATSGVDYPAIPDSVVIPPGQLTDSITIIPIQDNTIEPTETIILSFDYESACNTETDSLEFLLLDNSIALSGLDSSYCSSEPPDTLQGYPPTGVYSGTGMNDSIFNPALSTPGTNVIIFTNYFIDYSASPDDTVCINSITDSTEVLFAPIVEAGSDEAICQGNFHDFLNSTATPSSMDADSLRWIGGAGSFSNNTALSPIYYPAPGETGGIQLSLIGYSHSPCSHDTSTMTLTILEAPIFDFAMSPNDTSCLNEVINFDGNSSDNIIAWNWNFGDGNNASGQNVTHSFPISLIYNIQLIATRDNGCSDTVTHPRVVLDPSIDFSMSPSPGCLNDTIDF